MNLIITLSIFGAILIQDSASEPFPRITSLKHTVESVSSDLHLYDQNFYYDLNIKLRNLKILQMTNINRTVNRALSDAKNVVEAVKSVRRNRKSCYELTRQRLDDASKAASGALEKCLNDHLDILKSYERDIGSHLKSGESLLLYLDIIPHNCASHHAGKTKYCISQKSQMVSQNVLTFQNHADLLKNIGNSLSSDSEVTATRCYQAAVDKLYVDVTSARNHLTNCVNLTCNLSI